MRWMKWTGLAAVIILITACFLPWVTILSKNIIVTGINATGTSFGKPGYLHLFFSFFFIICTLVPYIAAKRVNLLVTAFNTAWALRNYFLISACRGGECPEKNNGIYLILIASIVMLVTALFPDVKIPVEKNERSDR
jgi:uncharacterized membrane protein YhaH (DUF805 family)